MRKTLYLFFVLFVINSCCEPSYNIEDNIPIQKNNKGIQIIVQTKNANNEYINLRTDTVEWLGANRIVTVNNDTISYLELDIKSNQTKFKIVHQLGIDTCIFNYNWSPVTHGINCGGANKMERNRINFSVASNRGKVKDSLGIYLFKIN
ncbi:MAG: hypothetical protein ACOYMA_04850 [Bacteroidia bacterium]